MIIASYRNTERGAREIYARRHAEAIARQREKAEAERQRREREEEKIREYRRQMWERAAAKVAADRRKGKPYKPSYETIERRVCRALKVSRADLHGTCRKVEFVIARQAISYWARRRTELSMPQIGRLMGDRDHTTILSGVRAYPGKRAKMGRTVRSLD